MTVLKSARVELIIGIQRVWPIWLLSLTLLAGCGGGSDSTPGDLSQGETSTLADSAFIGDHYSGSGNCSLCHDGLVDAAGNDISIVANWGPSMMANASRDPYWQAKVASELKRNPQLSDFLNDACSRCHAPMANDAAKKDGVEPEIFAQGFLSPDNAYFDHAMDGVSCSLCHQIADTGLLGEPEGMSGGFEVISYTNKVDRPAYGQYSDPFQTPMQLEVEFTPQLGLHTGTSEVCASCHNLKTPFIDSAGNLTNGEFPEQMVYSEWENSDFVTGGIKEQSCQACHMPEIETAALIANRPPFLFPRVGFSSHNMLGANTVMMEILDSNREELGVVAEGFDQAIEQNRAFLRGSATLEFGAYELVNSELSVELKITNHTGHKLPTSYPARRMFIHLQVEDGNGVTLFESGKVNSDGSVVGIDADADNSTFEPHYDLITEQNQVQVYEPIMGDTDGNVTHSLLRAAGYLKDNRLSPSGFDKNLVSEDIQVAGTAYDDSNFNSGSDTLTYRIPIGNSKGLTVTAELKYQSLSYGHLQNLFEDAELSEVSRFQQMFESAKIRAETITSKTLTTIN